MTEETNAEETCQLVTALQQFMDAEGWDDSIQTNETGTRFTVATSMLISEQKHRLFIEIEPPTHIFVFFYTYFLVPRSRLDVTTRIINRLNTQLLFGRLAVDDGPKPRPVQFRTGLHLEEALLTPSQIDAMIGLGVSTFQMHEKILALACFTERSVDEIWAEHERLAAEEESSEWSSVKVPRLLN